MYIYSSQIIDTFSLPWINVIWTHSLLLTDRCNMKAHEAIVASMQESKLKIVNDIIKNAPDNFIE